MYFIGFMNDLLIQKIEFKVSILRIFSILLFQ